MIRILDYIFYRTYIEYKKKKQPAKLLSSLYTGLTILFFFLPLFAIFGYMVRGDNDFFNKSVYGMYCFLIFIFVYIRYCINKDKIIEMMDDFSNYSLNRKIPTWCFFFVFPISMVVGVTGLILITKYIVDPYGLTGIWNPFFANLFGN